MVDDIMINTSNIIKKDRNSKIIGQIIKIYMKNREKKGDGTMVNDKRPVPP